LCFYETNSLAAEKQSIILNVISWLHTCITRTTFFESRKNIVPWLRWTELQSFKCFHSKLPKSDSYVVWALKMKRCRYHSLASLLLLCTFAPSSVRGKNSWVHHVNLSSLLRLYILQLSYWLPLFGLCLCPFVRQHKKYLLYLALIILGMCVIIIA
jgi:hypothetical protein